MGSLILQIVLAVFLGVVALLQHFADRDIAKKHYVFRRGVPPLLALVMVGSIVVSILTFCDSRKQEKQLRVLYEKTVRLPDFKLLVNNQPVKDADRIVLKDAARGVALRFSFQNIGSNSAQNIQAHVWSAASVSHMTAAGGWTEAGCYVPDGGGYTNDASAQHFFCDTKTTIPPWYSMDV